MSQYFLSHGTRLCETHDGIVFLNLHDGRYFGLGQEHCQIFKSLLHGNSAANSEHPDPLNTSDQQALANLLIAKGLLTTDKNRGNPPKPQHIHAKRGLENNEAIARAPRGAIWWVIAFCLSITIVSLSLRLCSLHTVISRVEQRNRKLTKFPAATEENTVLALTMCFKRMRPWAYTTANRCLFDSLVLATFLQHCGVPAHLMIGVSTRPFLAHAWVQYDDIVLNDDLENIDGLHKLITT